MVKKDDVDGVVKTDQLKIRLLFLIIIAMAIYILFLVHVL